MTHEQGQTLDEQIAFCEAQLASGERHHNGSGIVKCNTSLLASLRRLKAIDEAVLPEEPEVPNPDYAQIIQFEGASCVVIAPEDYEALFNYASALKLHAQKSAEAARVAREELSVANRALRIAEAKNKGTLANNLCPDHRDKQHGRQCLACIIETAESRLREVEAGHRRYEYLRTLNVEQFKSLFIRSLNGERFDDLVDRALPSSTDTEEK